MARGGFGLLGGEGAMLRCSWHGCPSFDLSKIHRHVHTATFCPSLVVTLWMTLNEISTNERPMTSSELVLTHPMRLSKG
jgi:hypothetical protein